MDQRSVKDRPKWYMVDVKFVRRLPHFVPLWVLKAIAAAPPPSGGWDAAVPTETMKILGL